MKKRLNDHFVHIRLIGLQPISELHKKADKSIRKGYGKRGSFFRGTIETHDLLFRQMDERSTKGVALTTAE